MRRRPHGEGAVYKRGEGWVAVLKLDSSVDGRRRRRHLYGKRVLMDVLGHTRMSTTSDLYTHFLHEVRVDATQRMDTIIRVVRSTSGARRPSTTRSELRLSQQD